MESAKLNDRLQILGMAGIIASLIFVGLELQQSRQIAIADIYQQRTAMVIEVQNNRFSPEQFRDALNKAVSGQALTTSEVTLLNYSWNPWFSYYENNHFQYEMGLLSEEHWISSHNDMRSYVRLPSFEAWWESGRSGWRESFAQVVDEAIAEEKAKQ